MSESKWNTESVKRLFELPLVHLLFEAQCVHRLYFHADELELCTLLSIKTGACPEDCAYCPQSAHYSADASREKLIDVEKVVRQAQIAKEKGAVRFCMGAAWRSPPKKDFHKVLEIIRAVKNLGLETCVTLGMLNAEQAAMLYASGLDFYNHNLDTSPEYYKKIITTRTYQDRLDTLHHVRTAGIKVCCGGIIGMGESREDRIALLIQLASLPKPPESVPINRLIPFEGTPLANSPTLDNFEFIRTIAVARILMPTSILRLSAGRITMSEEMQALCFMAGINSMWLGEKLLTAKNPQCGEDHALLQKLGMKNRKVATQ
ncbi:biotin synthase BioB [Aquicella lusitana]|uniref:Biotin synthase n=1 Tax=Aquicella lusitana TaxID=254246 RepID=A0A370GF37_9COXI|nr:biotin synthase BioB [Aquicella lusitana]RDI42428.1 biotin synthase [Aquicella lusitana]VVC74110.1 Biotin synthase [Aquicella lusitana]